MPASLTPISHPSQETLLLGMPPSAHAWPRESACLVCASHTHHPAPLQSERFYQALKGHGAVCRLVLLPHESHGYRARESVLHTLYEQVRARVCFGVFLIRGKVCLFGAYQQVRARGQDAQPACACHACMHTKHSRSVWPAVMACPLVPVGSQALRLQLLLYCSCCTAGPVD